VLIDRSESIHELLLHSWSYAPLLFDIFNPQNNKILFKGETKIEEFELDFFKDEVLQKI